MTMAQRRVVAVTVRDDDDDDEEEKGSTFHGDKLGVDDAESITNAMTSFQEDLENLTATIEQDKHFEALLERARRSHNDGISGQAGHSQIDGISSSRRRHTPAKEDGISSWPNEGTPAFDHPSRSKQTRSASKTPIRDYEPSPMRTPAPLLFSPDDLSRGDLSHRKSRSVLLEDERMNGLDFRRNLKTMYDTIDSLNRRVTSLERENEQLRSRLGPIERFLTSLDGDTNGPYGFDGTRHGEITQRRPPTFSRFDGTVRASDRRGDSPGASFVSELSRFIDVDPGYQLRLRDAMDKYFQRRHDTTPVGDY